MARSDELAKHRSRREVGMPLPLSKAIQAGLPTMNFGIYAKLGDRVPVRGAGRQLAGRARAGRRRGLHHAVELPAAPDRGQGRAGARGGLHRRAEAERGRADQRVHARRGRRSRSGCPPGVFNLVTGYRAGGRRGARGASRGRHGLVHRFDARRSARLGARRADDQARAPRARRQVRERGARRRGPREGGRRHASPRAS